MIDTMCLNKEPFNTLRGALTRFKRAYKCPFCYKYHGTTVIPYRDLDPDIIYESSYFNKVKTRYDQLIKEGATYLKIVKVNTAYKLKVMK